MDEALISGRRSRSHDEYADCLALFLHAFLYKNNLADIVMSSPF